MLVLVLRVMMRVAAGMCPLANVLMVMLVLMREMHIELHPFDVGLVPARDVQMIAFELELFQLPLQFLGINTQIQERADEHIAADAAENIQIQGLHKVRLFVHGVISPCAA